VKDLDTGRILGELLEPGQKLVVARGGEGGRGNEAFKSARNRAPRRFTRGEPGERKRLEVTLKLIADVGLVGEPNAGKSTLLSRLSRARPKVAPYPFTTKTPVLGIVKWGPIPPFVMVDIPGLIEGAHLGKGMGRDFLRHVERCKVLLYLVDVTAPDPVASYEAVRQEVFRYKPELLERPSVVALTKCDLVGGRAGVDPKLLELHRYACPISAVSGEGLDDLLATLSSLL